MSRMSELFSPEGSVGRVIMKFVYSAWLNVLWFLCSLPIVTIGASTTALFAVSLKVAKGEEGNVARSFFRAFRQNFKQATKIWLIMLALGIVLALDGYVFYHMRFTNAFWAVLAAIYLVAVAAYLIELMYLFPLLAYFDNTTKAMFKNAMMIGVHFLLCTVLMAVIYVGVAAVAIFIYTPVIVFGFGLCALLCSYFLNNIFARCEPKEETEEEQELAEGLAAGREAP